MKSEFYAAVAQIASERGIPPEEVIEKVQQALISAYKRRFGGGQNISVRIDPATGTARVYAEKRVVEEVEDPREEISLAEARRLLPNARLGEVITIETTPRDFGRIAAQTARQTFMQHIREAERNKVLGEFAGRVGEMISAVVRRVTPQGVYLSADRAELFMPAREQIPNERYRINQHLQVFITEIRDDKHGPQIIVSRSHPKLVERLFEMEVPEVMRGAVEIVALAREPGVRSKVAVRARQPGVDPVGSCVGQRGVRIQSIVNALNGEKIDVLPWNPDPAAFIASALSPATVLEVRIDEENHTATVLVPDKSLSLAIGKEGQNARLAARLTGWKIDIKSLSTALEEGEVIGAGEVSSVEAAVLVQDPELASAAEETRQVRPDGIVVYQKVAYGPLPSEYIGKTVRLLATSQRVYLYDGEQLLASYRRGEAQKATPQTPSGKGDTPVPPEVWAALAAARPEQRKVSADGTLIYQHMRYGPLPPEHAGREVEVRSTPEYLAVYQEGEPIALFHRGEAGEEG
ncbi:MAG: transcription termination factor NusA [Chloroflexia bacterium]